MAEEVKIPVKAMQAINIALMNPRAKNKSLPHISSLVENFIEEMGGIEGFSKALAADFKNAKPGSMVRLRVYDLIAHAWKFSQQTGGAREDLGMMNEADLDREMQEILEKYGQATAKA